MNKWYFPYFIIIPFVGLVFWIGIHFANEMEKQTRERYYGVAVYNVWTKMHPTTPLTYGEWVAGRESGLIPNTR